MICVSNILSLDSEVETHFSGRGYKLISIACECHFNEHDLICIHYGHLRWLHTILLTALLADFLVMIPAVPILLIVDDLDGLPFVTMEQFLKPLDHVIFLPSYLYKKIAVHPPETVFFPVLSDESLYVHVSDARK